MRTGCGSCYNEYSLVLMVCTCSVAVSLNIAGLRNVLQLCKQMSKLEVSLLQFTLLLSLSLSLSLSVSILYIRN